MCSLFTLQTGKQPQFSMSQHLAISVLNELLADCMSQLLAPRLLSLRDDYVPALWCTFFCCISQLPQAASAWLTSDCSDWTSWWGFFPSIQFIADSLEYIPAFDKTLHSFFLFILSQIFRTFNSFCKWLGIFFKFRKLPPISIVLQTFNL